MVRIVIFAKAPVPGQVKTRLAPLLGSDGAAELARTMLARTCAEAIAVAGARAELCTSPDASDPSWEGRIPDCPIAITSQGSGDLGERLARAAKRVITAGDPAVLIGTDCPALDRERLAAACDAVTANDAFIHPADDGGYALLALRRFSPLLFDGIAWSTDSVAAETIARLQRLGWDYAVGDTLRDVDDPGDYQACFGSGGAA